MVSDIEFLEAVCDRMQQVGLVQSKAEFSRTMLGKGPSYLTSMSARDRKVSDEVVASLTRKLQKDVADDDAAIAQFVDAATRRGNERKHRADMLDWAARRQALATEPEPRQHRPTITHQSLAKRLIGWLDRSRVLIP